LCRIFFLIFYEWTKHTRVGTLSLSLLYLKIGYRLSLQTILGFLTGGVGQYPKYQLHLVVAFFFWQFRTSGFVHSCSDWYSFNRVWKCL
jgi:hypothetical protein